MRRWLRHLPNLISSIRILLAVPIAVALFHHQLITTLWLFGVAAVSDGVDGFIAKQFGWRSELGGILDPLADKLMLATVFVMLAILGDVPVWLTTAVLLRDGIIVLGAISYRMLLGPAAAHPSRISKLNTLCQVTFILVRIGTMQFAWANKSWELALGAGVLVTVVISGIDYVLVYGRLALLEGKARRAGARPESKPA